MTKIIFIRTSTTDQNPELQLSEIGKLTNIDECIVISEQESAFNVNSKRESFDKLISLIKSGTVSDIFVWHIDRIHRNRKKLIEFFHLCKIFNVKIFSSKQQFLNQLNNIPEPFNEIMFDMMIQILGFMAEHESETKGARVKNAVVKKKGKTLSYKGNPWGRKPFSKQIVSKVLNLRKQGYSIRNIASLVKVYDSNRNEKNISKSSVQKILHTNTV